MSIPSVGDVIAAVFGERQADPGLVVYGPCCRAEPEPEPEAEP